MKGFTNIQTKNSCILCHSSYDSGTLAIYLELGTRGQMRSSHFNESGVIRQHIESNARESGVLGYLEAKTYFS